MYVVANETNYELQIHLKKEGADTVVYVPSSTEKAVHTDERIGGLRDVGDKFLDFGGIDSIWTYVNDTMQVTKNMMDRSNWTYSTELTKANKKNGYNIYTYTLTSADVE